jgi:hypothetical protein
VQQHDEPGAALDQGPDRRAAQAEDQIALPVSGHRAVLSLGGTLADQDLIGHEPLAAGAWLRARGTRSARPVRRQAVSARRSTPRPWMYSAW